MECKQTTDTDILVKVSHCHECPMANTTRRVCMHPILPRGRCSIMYVKKGELLEHCPLQASDTHIILVDAAPQNHRVLK